MATAASWTFASSATGTANPPPAAARRAGDAGGGQFHRPAPPRRLIPARGAAWTNAKAVFGRKTFGRSGSVKRGPCDEHRGASRLTLPMETALHSPEGLSCATATIRVIPSVVDKLFGAKKLVLRVEGLAKALRRPRFSPRQQAENGPAPVSQSLSGLLGWPRACTSAVFSGQSDRAIGGGQPRARQQSSRRHQSRCWRVDRSLRRADGGLRSRSSQATSLSRSNQALMRMPGPTRTERWVPLHSPRSRVHASTVFAYRRAMNQPPSRGTGATRTFSTPNRTSSEA